MKKIDGAIVTITANNNYGNIMQRWALQRFLEINGYNFVSYYFYGYYWRKYLLWQSWVFAIPRYVVLSFLNKKNLFVCSSIYNYHKLSMFCKKRINQEPFIPFFYKKYAKYIIGSDQNFNISTIGKEFFAKWSIFLLSFVNWPSLKISYASSFGKNSFTKKDRNIWSKRAKKLMQRFDSVSVREPSASEFTKRFWDIDSISVLDPTLLLDVQEYNNLIERSIFKLTPQPDLFFYLLREREDSKKYTFMKELAKKMNYSYDGTTAQEWKQMMPVEQWLYGLANSKLVITNSFHGTIFAIINHTDFLTLAATATNGGAVRYQDLLEKIGLSSRIVYEDDFETFRYDNLPKIDWDMVDKKIKKLRKESSEWLLRKISEDD